MQYPTTSQSCSSPARRLASALTLACTALLASASSLAAQKGILIKTDGAQLRGIDVEAETLKEVRYKRGGSTQSIAANEVKELRWVSPPDSFARAEIAANGGDLAAAANLYAEAASRGSSDAFKASAGFLAIDALVRAAGASESLARDAANAAARWVDTHAEHRQLPHALQLLGRARIAAGDGRGANEAFAKLEKVATENTLGPIWIGEGKYGQGLALMKAGEQAEARKQFIAAFTVIDRLDGKEHPEAIPLSVRIKVAQGESYIEAGDLRGAESFYQGLSSLGGKDPAFRTASLCGVGQALYEQGKEKNDIAKLRQAQMKFAEVSATDLLDGETCAKATYLLGKTLIALGSDKEGNGVGSRAAGIFKQVVTNYPNSRWAALARKELGS